MHLGEDLHRLYGSSAKAILACAMALTLNPGPFSSVASSFDSTYLRVMYGIEMPVSSRDMSEFTHNIGLSSACSDMFFQCRVNRVDGLAWDTATNGTHGEPGGAAERGAGKDRRIRKP